MSVIVNKGMSPNASPYFDSDDDDFDDVPSFRTAPSSIPKNDPPNNKHPLLQRPSTARHIAPCTSAVQAPPSKRLRVEQARVERENRKEEREAALRARRKQRIQDAFVSHRSTAVGRRSSVQIIVSNSLFADTSRNDVLKSIRTIFPDQLFGEERRNANLITWRRSLPPQGASNASTSAARCSSQPQSSLYSSQLLSSQQPDPIFEDIPLHLFVFPADRYLCHIERNTLDECARATKAALATTPLTSDTSPRLLFAIYDMDAEVRRRARTIVRTQSDSCIIDKQAVQDSYVHLLLEHDIRIHEARNLDEMAHYLRDVTDAIAAAPYRQEHDLVSASLSLRRKRARACSRTAVVTAPGSSSMHDSQLSIPDASQSEDVSISFDVNDRDECGDNLKQAASIVRVEGLGDLGNLYLTMLCLIPGVTLIRAQSIRERYPTLRTLLDAYDDCTSEQQKMLLLSDLRHGEHGRRLGPVLSKSIAAVFTSLRGDLNV